MKIDMKEMQDELEEIFKVKAMVCEFLHENKISLRIGIPAMLHLIADTTSRAPDLKEAMCPTLSMLLEHYEKMRNSD